MEQMSYPHHKALTATCSLTDTLVYLNEHMGFSGSVCLSALVPAPSATSCCTVSHSEQTSLAAVLVFSPSLRVSSSAAQRSQNLSHASDTVSVDLVAFGCRGSKYGISTCMLKQTSHSHWIICCAHGQMNRSMNLHACMNLSFSTVC